MKKISSLSLAAVGSNDKLEVGELAIPKGTKCPGIRLKVTCPVANASGGAVTLTDAQKQALLADFDLTLKCAGRTPFKVVAWNVMNRIMRRLYGSEIEGYSNSTNGLAKAMSDGNTHSLVFYLVVPLGRFWKWGRKKDLLAYGRSQMECVELEVRRNSNAILTGVTISGTVSIEVSCDTVAAKGDRWSPGFEYEESDTANKVAYLSPGMPIAIEERTAVLASTSLTNVSLSLDELEVHDQVTPAEIATESNDVPNVPAEAYPSDRVTPLYEVNSTDIDPAECPTGRPAITQNVKDLATIKLSQVFVPIVPKTEIEAFGKKVASELRSKRLKLASVNATEALGLPEHSAFISPVMLLDDQDREWEQYPGTIVKEGAAAEVVFPSSMIEGAKARHAQLTAAGEKQAADKLVRDLAAAVPGAVQSPRGFKRNEGDVLASVRRQVAA